MHDLEFQYPWVFLLLLLLPLLGILYLSVQGKSEAVTLEFSQLELVKEAYKGIIEWHKICLIVWFIVTFIIFTCIIAKPKASIYMPVKSAQLMMLLDISISMGAQDLKPSRLEAAKKAAINFIKHLPAKTKIGLILFYGGAYIAAPLDQDKTRILEAINTLTSDDLQQGTAIGSAIQLTVKTFEKNAQQNSSHHNKTKNVILLITDGESNIGYPVDKALTTLQNLRIPVFTIGIGSSQGAYVRGDILTQLQDDSLKHIATSTHGKYFRAEDEQKLSEIYEKIAHSSVIFEKEKQDISSIFALIGFCLFLIFTILQLTVFKVYPH